MPEAHIFRKQGVTIFFVWDNEAVSYIVMNKMVFLTREVSQMPALIIKKKI